LTFDLSFRGHHPLTFSVNFDFFPFSFLPFLRLQLKGY
jgi:hypothetical protein